MKAALVISERDNVATALEALEPGRRIEVGRKPVSSVKSAESVVASGASVESVVVVEAIPSGHKVALGPIAAGAPVIKYGSPIGLATADIAAGAHVHTHNLSSSRGRGDLPPAAGARDPRTRLAEPPDGPALSDVEGPNGADPQSSSPTRRRE